MARLVPETPSRWGKENFCTFSWFRTRGANSHKTSAVYNLHNLSCPVSLTYHFIRCRHAHHGDDAREVRMVACSHGIRRLAHPVSYSPLSQICKGSTSRNRPRSERPLIGLVRRPWRLSPLQYWLVGPLLLLATCPRTLRGQRPLSLALEFRSSV